MVLLIMRYLLGIGGVWLWAQVCGTAQVAPVPRGISLPALRRATWPDTACHPHATYVIPIVFHVIHGGGTDSLPLSVIEDQMQRLFEDFRRLPGSIGFTPKGTDMDIEFALATLDPAGQPTTGVVYWRWDQPPLSWSQPGLCVTDEYAMKLATGWPPDKYLNVWVVPAICGFSGDCNDCSGIAGYAYYPDIGPSVVYGSVVGTPFIGGRLTGRGGRTLVHELGHNLGLAHTFEGGCGTLDCTTSGDEVCDTPPTIDANFGVRRQNTCDTDSPDRPDEPRNYMDYVDDASMSHFTEGQRWRAEGFLLSDWSSLWPLYQSANLQATGTGPYGRPKAAFWVEANRVLPGTPVRFHAVTEGHPHIFQWDFGGGVPDNSASPCPTVVFPTAGSYTVQLVVENLSGRRDTFIQPGAVVVEDSVWSLPFFQDWESAPFPPAGFSLQNLDAGQGGSRTWERWRRSNGPPAGAYGRSTYTLRLPYFVYSRYGERDYLLSPALDFRVDSGLGIQLSFAVSYACLEWGDGGSYPLTYADTLRVWVSPDGGARWDLVYEKGGQALSTLSPGCINAVNSPLNGATHMPDSTKWRTDTISLSRYKGIRGVRVRLEGLCGWGNHLYLDDLRIDTVRESTPSQPASLPQPFSLQGSSEGVFFSIASPEVLVWRVYTPLGQVVAAGEDTFTAGRHRLPIPSLPHGVYSVQVWNTQGVNETKAFLQLP